MSSELKPPHLHLEVGHILFLDIVGYSKLLAHEQKELIEELNQIVRETQQFRSAEAAHKLTRLPTGDGMVLVFTNNPEAPVECALEIRQKLQNRPQLELRMGIHSGPVNPVADVNDQANLAGAGINIAERVMSCGDTGHILLSKHFAEDLEHYAQWRAYLHDLGECEMKHGVRVGVVNLSGDGVGNAATPKKFETIKKHRAHVRWAAVAGALLVLGAIVGGTFFFSHRPTTSALRVLDKSIAVLPFQNLSDEKENAYFADGIQDDILTNLSKIGDLKVISRMSVMSYRGDGARNAREIGKALGVATLLEGSVRRIGNRVRVSVQLINANDDEHIWAEDYDRDLTDVFAIQTDLAQKIALSLQAKLSPNEKERLDRRPTQNSDAYLLYVQAHDYANQPDRPHDTSLKAEELFERAIKLDPKFALAFAGLSEVQSWIYHSYEPTPARRENARLNANESLRLQPDLPEGHLALGYSYYYGDRDYGRALTEFEIAKRDLPNEADAYSAIAAIQRRQGKWAESTANFEKSASLDPKNANVLFNLAINYMAQRDFEVADKILDRGIAADPQSFGSRGMKASLAIIWKGDVGFAENQLSLSPPGLDPDGYVTSARVWVLTLKRTFADALQMAQQFRGETLKYPDFGLCPKASLEGRLYLYQDDKLKARAAFERARTVAEQLVREAPGEPGRHASLGVVLAGLGQKEDAINEGKKAVELLPESDDAVDGPKATAALAEIYAWVGEHDEAFRLLDHLLAVPNGLTVPLLKLDPVWDPLRKDPRFQALIDKYAAKR